MEGEWRVGGERGEWRVGGERGEGWRGEIWRDREGAKKAGRDREEGVGE